MDGEGSDEQDGDGRCQDLGMKCSRLMLLLTNIEIQCFTLYCRRNTCQARNRKWYTSGTPRSHHADHNLPYHHLSLHLLNPPLPNCPIPCLQTSHFLRNFFLKTSIESHGTDHPESEYFTACEIFQVAGRHG